MLQNLLIDGHAEASEMEEHLLGLLEKVRAGEIYFLATTATRSNGVIEQRHLRGQRGPATGYRCDRF